MSETYDFTLAEVEGIAKALRALTEVNEDPKGSELTIKGVVSMGVEVVGRLEYSDDGYMTFKPGLKPKEETVEEESKADYPSYKPLPSFTRLMEPLPYL